MCNDNTKDKECYRTCCSPKIHHPSNICKFFKFTESFSMTKYNNVHVDKFVKKFCYSRCFTIKQL